MSRFVTGKELEEVVYDILFEAKRQLLLVSPYIKLDTYFREILDRHARNPELEIIVVFGKNEGNVTRSVSRADIDYFTKFTNVTLIYAPNLHAKYYGNEVKGVVTSINLYDYSFRHNIEFGVYSENAPLMEKLMETINKKSLEDQSFEQAMLVASTHDVIFAKRPVYKMRGGLMSKFVGGKDYLEPKVVVNFIDDLLQNRPFNSTRLDRIPKKIEFSQTLSQVRPSRQDVEARATVTPQVVPAEPVSTPPKEERPGLDPAIREEIRKRVQTPVTRERISAPVESLPPSKPSAQPIQPSSYQSTTSVSSPQHRLEPAPPVQLSLQPAQSAWSARTTPSEPGFCIRTGASIPFNPERPFCYPAFKSWAKFSNDVYPERYCHRTGQLSNGKTSKRNPVLVKS